LPLQLPLQQQQQPWRSNKYENFFGPALAWVEDPNAPCNPRTAVEVAADRRLLAQTWNTLKADQRKEYRAARLREEAHLPALPCRAPPAACRQ